MTTGPADDKAVPQSPRRRRGWLWFAAGSLVVFVGMAVAVTMYPLNRRGDAVMRYPLWRYYLVEVRRAVESDNTMGPTSGSSTAAATTFLQHLLCATAGGLVVYGARRLVLKVRGTAEPDVAPDRQRPA